MASRASRIRLDDSVATRAPILFLETVCRWSQLTAHALDMPSAFSSSTSLGISRMVEVMGATVTSPDRG